MKFMKRVLIGLTFYFCCSAVVLLCVAFGTKYWIESSPVRDVANVTRNNTNTDLDTRFVGTIHLGLFEEHKLLNYGWGDRESTLWIVCWPAENVCIWSPEQDANARLEQLKKEYSHRGQLNYTTSDQINNTVKYEYDRDAAFIDFRLWLATIIFLSLAILFGVVGAGFALLNALTTPIECITGVRGLYVWNTIAAVFNLICIIMWVLLYYTKFKDNVMSSQELQYGWTSKDHSSFGYSFWIVVGAMLLYILNLVIIFISSIEPEYQRRTNAVVNEKPADGVIMLF